MKHYHWTYYRMNEPVPLSNRLWDFINKRNEGISFEERIKRDTYEKV